MRAHRFAPVSLIFGVIFAGIGLVVLQGDIDPWLISASWFWSLVLTLAGVTVLLSARPKRDDDTAPGNTDDTDRMT